MEVYMTDLESSIHKAYFFLRKNEHSIPDEHLDFIRDAALMELKEKEKIDNLVKALNEIGDNKRWTEKTHSL